ncbi:stromal cell-derived factor 2-like [Mustelus asterias]
MESGLKPVSGLLRLWIVSCFGVCGILGTSELSYVTCGSVIKLLNTRHNVRLHSHDVKYGSVVEVTGSMEEVSAFGEDGEGDSLDNWTVVCSGTYWERKNPVKFKHTATEVLLSVTGEQFGRPISGQLEVHGMQYSNQYNSWKAMEGIFMKPMDMSRAGADAHIEL